MINHNIENKRRILVVGANGLLGQNLIKLLSKTDEEVLAASIENNFIGSEKVSYSKLDIANRNEVKKILFSFHPTFVINAAAYTNVDGCETNKDLCWKVNVIGVKHLADLSRAIDAKLIHISTDFVFDGEKGPYNEMDKLNPISYYGRSKMAGENEIFIAGIPYIIIRTNVLYGNYIRTSFEFVNWVVESLREGKPIRIVNDQYNNPTYIVDLAKGIYQAIQANVEGIFNIGGIELLNRFDFTHKIADVFNLDKNLIIPIKTIELNQKAKRPLKSGLIISKAQSEFGYLPGTIEENLLIMKKEINL